MGQIDTMNDHDFMSIALDLAAKGTGYTSPNPMVGAVVVSGGKIVGKGWHESVGGPHAEVNAIDNAGDLAKGATLFVTLEPCNHHGRTPPCTRKILSAGIKRVVCQKRYHAGQDSERIFLEAKLKIEIIDDEVMTYSN